MPFRIDELRAAIAAGEGREVEFKRGLPSDFKVARSLCAFANTRGGFLFIGVGDRGELEGAPHPEATGRKLCEIAARRVEPPLAPHVEVVRIDGIPLVVARMAASLLRPHAVLRDELPPEIVIRSGSSNRVASKSALAALRQARRSPSSLDEFERGVLAFVEAVVGFDPNASVEVSDFAKARNVGAQRARRAFLRLEREGFLVGIGLGRARRYRVL